MNAIFHNIQENYGVYSTLASALITFLIGLHLPLPRYMLDFYDFMLNHKTIIIQIGEDVIAAVQANGMLKVTRYGRVVKTDSEEAKSDELAVKAAAGNPFQSTLMPDTMNSTVTNDGNSTSRSWVTEVKNNNP